MSRTTLDFLKSIRNEDNEEIAHNNRPVQKINKRSLTSMPNLNTLESSRSHEIVGDRELGWMTIFAISGVITFSLIMKHVKLNIHRAKYVKIQSSEA